MDQITKDVKQEVKKRIDSSSLNDEDDFESSKGKGKRGAGDQADGESSSAKKMKPIPAEGAGGLLEQVVDNGSTTSWQIGNSFKQASISDYKGVSRIDFREYYRPADSAELKPTQKGIAFDKSEFEKLKAVLPQALVVLKAAGAKVPSGVILPAQGDGKKEWLISGKKKVSVSEYRGKSRLDMRNYWGEPDDLKPTKKGISISPEDIPQFLEFFPVLNGAVAKFN